MEIRHNWKSFITPINNNSFHGNKFKQWHTGHYYLHNIMQCTNYWSATRQILAQYMQAAWGPHNYSHTTVHPIIYSVRKNVLTISFSLVQPLSVLPLGAVIAVAAVGAVLLLAVLVALLVCGWCCLRRRRRYEYSTGEYRVTVQTWNATNPIHYTVSKSGSFSSRMSSIRSSFGLKPKVLSNSYKERQDHLYRNATTDIYSTPLW